MRPVHARALILGLIVLSLALAAASCGSKSDQGTQGATQAPPASPNTTATAHPESTTALANVTPSLELGEKVFKQRCVLCHGATGHGDGVAAAGLKPHPRNFHDAAYMKSKTDDELL